MPNETKKSLKVLGVDPGKSTGYALIEIKDKRIELTHHLGVDVDESIETIMKIVEEGIDHMVIEDFLVRPGMARKGNFDYNNMVAPRVIGKLELLCEMKSIPYTKQPASQKPAAYGFSGQTYKKGKKGTHFQDALAHACLYAVQTLGCAPITASKKS